MLPVRFVPLNPCVNRKKAPHGEDPVTEPAIFSLGSRLPVHFTFSGTAALSAAARVLKRVGRRRLLAPSFNCGHEIEPFLREQFALEVYRVDANCRIDLDHFRELLSGKDQVALITHYFGFPQDVKTVKSLCEEKDVFLIEDCAHAYLGANAGVDLGSQGDVAVFSYRKSLPLTDGGGIIFNRKDLCHEIARTPPHRMVVVKKAVKLMLDDRFLAADTGSGLAFELLRKIKGLILLGEKAMKWIAGGNHIGFYSPDDESFHFSSEIMDWSISDRAIHLLRLYDHEWMMKKRREHYRYVLAGLKGTKQLRPLFPELPEGVCPLEFPFVPPSEHPDTGRILARYPFLYQWWPHFHHAVSWNGFPESRWLKNNCRIIAIHQDLKRKHLDYLIDCAIQADRELS